MPRSPALEAASLRPAERRMLERFIAALRGRLGEDLLAVWLYGSRARGEPPGEESDVDVIVVVADERRHTRAVDDAAWAAAVAEGVGPFLFSTHIFDPEWVAGRRAIESFFMQEVDRDKIVLFGDP